MSLLQHPAGWWARAQEQIGAIRTMAATAEDREVIDALLADAGERVRAQDRRAEAQARGPAQRRQARCPAKHKVKHCAELYGGFGDCCTRTTSGSGCLSIGCAGRCWHL